MRSFPVSALWVFLCSTVLLVAPGAGAQMAQPGQVNPGQVKPADAEQLFALANLARLHEGLGTLKWDPALAEAARKHCLRMASEGPIEHRYGGEPSLTQRAAAEGARFSLIEENIAVGPSADAINQEWLHSPPHRANLLNPKVNRIGAAIVAARGTLYAVEDFSTGVEELSQTQVERRVADLIRPSGLKILDNPLEARQACKVDEGMPAARPGMYPRFLMRWQSSSLDELPKQLTQRLASGDFHSAAVGSCSPEGKKDSFSAYRVAVVLY